MYDVMDVADYMIKLANKQIDKDFDISEGITHLKLQKILYFAQATYLACLDKKLFDEKIIAYKYGPVIENIFEKYKTKDRGSLSITPGFNDDIIDDEDKKVLSDVWDYFGKYTAFQLVSMTHSHSPWKNTNQSDEIDINEIKSFYKGRISID